MSITHSKPKRRSAKEIQGNILAEEGLLARYDSPFPDHQERKIRTEIKQRIALLKAELKTAL